MFKSFAYTVLYLLIIIVPTSTNTNIKVKLGNVKNTIGTIRVGLFKNSEDFPNPDKTFDFRVIEARTNAVVSFKDVPDGTYAIAAWHDENNNEVLDKNWVGVPKEAYGFSKTENGTFGPPSFEKAAFKVLKGKVVELDINLK